MREVALHLCRVANGREGCVCDREGIGPCEAMELQVTEIERLVGLSRGDLGRLAAGELRTQKKRR